MRTPLLALLAAAALFVSGGRLAAQQVRVSQHATISTVVNGDRVMIVYGRPHTRDPMTHQPRKIWGGLVPYGEVWRTGADEATLLITEKPLTFAGTTVPAGAYTLWTLPQADGSAKLFINKQIGQWGIKGHNAPANRDPSLDIAQVDLTRKTLPNRVDQFTMAIDKAGAIRLDWENTEYSAPFTVFR